MNNKSKYILIAICVIILILVFKRENDKNHIENAKKQEQISLIKDLKDSVAVYKQENVKLIEKHNIEKDSIVSFHKQKNIEKSIEVDKLYRENKNLSSTFIKFDYAEEFYGLGKNIKNLVMTQTQFEKIVQAENKYKEYESIIEKQTSKIEIVEKENMILEEEKSNIENQNRILISKIDRLSNKTETKEVENKFAKTYSITIDAKGLYGNEGLEGELSAYVKKYLVNFEQDGVFISGGYKNTNINEHTGFIGVGVEF